jgi:diguanylate cyclase (GGDEF)-like protein
MKVESIENVPKDVAPAESLSRLLGQNEDVRSLVEQSAGELTALNRALKDEAADQGAPAAVTQVLEKSESVEKKVLEASEKLATVNLALKGEIEDRQVLEIKLADVTEKEATARHVAFHDPLTGLPNRALFKDRLELGLAQAKRHDWSLAVMFMDLDGFKNINDTFGHDVGDYVLQIIAGRLRENTRVDDTVCRLGGDEFTYLLMEAGTPQEIALIAQKMIKAIQVPFDVRANGVLISLSINPSIGISIFPSGGTTAESLVKTADKAMYDAKQARSGYALAA